MPPIPPPEGMHILVVHFPIALLFVAPLFVLLGALTGARSMMISALILMLLGVAGAFVATWTGDLAMDVMGQAGDFEIEDSDTYDLAYEVLDEHEERAEYARNLFAGLTALYVGLVLLTTLSKPMSKALPRILLNLVFLALWAYPVTEIANAAHAGGRLVHEFGLRSVLAETVEGVEEVEESAEQQEGSAEEEPAPDSEAEEEDDTPADDPDAASTDSDAPQEEGAP